MKLTPKQQQAFNCVQSNGEVGICKTDISLTKTYMTLVKKGLLKISKHSNLHTWFEVAQRSPHPSRDGVSPF